MSLKGGFYTKGKVLTNIIDLSLFSEIVDTSLQVGLPVQGASSGPGGGTVLVSLAINLGGGSSQVIGTLPIGNGGTGSSGPYTSGDIIIYDGGTNTFTTTGSTSITNPTFTTVTAQNIYSTVNTSVTNNISATVVGVLLVSNINIVTAAVAGAGVILPVIAAGKTGMIIGIVNLTTFPIYVKPPTGVAIGLLAAGVAATLAAGAAVILSASSTTQWVTISPPIIVGSGLSVTYDSMDTTIANTGVLSVVGTANQILPTAATTGAVTLSLDTNLLLPGSVTDKTGIYFSTTLNIAAAGTTLATATQLTTAFNVVSQATAGVSTGVKLPSVSQGFICNISNNTNTTINVYPYSTGQGIDAMLGGNPLVLASWTSVCLQCASAGWNTISRPVMSSDGSLSVAYNSGAMDFSLVTPVTVARGGTGSTTALQGTRYMYSGPSSAPKMIESSVRSLTGNDLIIPSGTWVWTQGTASQSNSNTVVGVATNFPYQCVGGLLIYSTGQSALVTEWISATSLTVDTVLTVAATTYTITFYSPVIVNSSMAASSLYTQLLTSAQLTIAAPNTRTTYQAMGLYTGALDNDYLLFDQFQQGGSFYRSGAAAPFAVAKNNGKLRLQYDAAGTAGSQTTMQDAFSVDAAGAIVIGTPPTGGLNSPQQISLIVTAQNLSYSSIQIYNKVDLDPHISLLSYGSSGTDGSDSNAITFDGYFSNGSWVSSSNTAAVTMWKSGANLNIQYSGAVTKGSFITWATGLQVQGGTGQVWVGSSGVGFVNGSTGYTGSLLNYYDQGVTIMMTISGALTGALGTTISRLGNRVTMWLPTAGGTAASASNIVMTPGGYFSTLYAPAQDFYEPCVCSNLSQIQTGYIYYNSAAKTFNIALNTGTFSSGSAIIFNGKYLTWTIN